MAMYLQPFPYVRPPSHPQQPNDTQLATYIQPLADLQPPTFYSPPTACAGQGKLFEESNFLKNLLQQYVSAPNSRKLRRSQSHLQAGAKRGTNEWKWLVREEIAEQAKRWFSLTYGETNGDYQKELREFMELVERRLDTSYSMDLRGVSEY